MTGSNSRKRITVIASTQGVETAERALIRLGFETKTNFAKAQLVARTAVTKFFNCQPLQLDTFKRVCEGLELNWREILDSESKTDTGQLLETGQPEIVDMRATETSQDLGTTVAIARRQVTVLDHQKVIKARVILEGDITSVDANFKTTLEVLLKCYGGDTIEITDIHAGSIRITIQGSEQDVERLRERLASGELTQINDFPIQTIEILGEERLEAPETPELQNKWELIQAIKTQPQQYRQLREIDLSEADLSGANLSGADLSGADLSGADLSGADLSGADLSNSTARGLARALDLARGLDRGLNRVRARARGLDRDRALALASALASARDLALALARGLARDLDLDLDLDLNRAIDRARDLDFANLSGANLSGANLSGANLSGANLSGAFVEKARFGRGIGLSESEKRDLEQRGAIFDESVGDRESAYFPINR